jgi:glycosyl transferase, family 25
VRASPRVAAGLDRWFAHKVCLNLDRRPERWARMQDRFAQHGIADVVRFSAIDGEDVDVPPRWNGTAGAYGCLLSNLAVVEQARARQWPEVLVFEDDVVFDDGLNAKLPDLMAEVPSDWDMLFFGGMHREAPVRVREHVLKLSGTTSTYAYAVRRSIYDAFLDVHAESRDPIDVRNRVLQEQFNCYCFFPHLAWVDGGPSDTQGRPVNPWWLRDSLILAGETIDDIQARTLIVIAHGDNADPELARRNLAYTTHAYRKHLPRAAMVVAGRDPSFDVSLLPRGCAYVSIDAEEGVDMARLFNAGIARFSGGVSGDGVSGPAFYVCADRDIVPTWDVRAHLIKCIDHDLATSARDIIDLTAEDSARLVNHQPHGETDYPIRPRRGHCAEGCVVTRGAFERSGGWLEAGASSASAEPGSHRTAALSLRGLDGLTLFDSPALGMRLFAGARRSPHGRRAC